MWHKGVRWQHVESDILIAWYQSQWNLARTHINFQQHRSCPTFYLFITVSLHHSMCFPTAIFTAAFKEHPPGYLHSATPLVLTGKKGNVDRDLQWRQTCKPLELRLAKDMPNWTKAAFRVFKATLKFVQQAEDKGSSDTICGLRFVGRVLKYSSLRGDMIQLLVHLDHHLKIGHLPHNFIPECNLLDCVHEEEIVSTWCCF